MSQPGPTGWMVGPTKQNETMVRTKAQNTLFHTLVAGRLDKEEKAAFVRGVTGGRTGSSAEMTTEEMSAAIRHLSHGTRPAPPPAPAVMEVTASMKKMRAKLIGVCRDIFGLNPSGPDWTQAHYDRLNVFLRAKFNRQLHTLDAEGLRRAVTAVVAWRDWETKRMVNRLLNPTETDAADTEQG